MVFRETAERIFSAYIGDDYRLSKHIERRVYEEYDREEFIKLQQAIRERVKFVDTIDIGAGYNPYPALLWLDAITIRCVDPAYRWYNYRDPNNNYPFAPSVAGGVENKRHMKRLARKALDKLRFPNPVWNCYLTVIEGVRENKPRRIELLPVAASEWLAEDDNSDYGNLVVRRIFPSAEEWGALIERLKLGGMVITSGYGRLIEVPGYHTRAFSPEISRGGGADVLNTPLPLNGNCEALGLDFVAEAAGVYFYQKQKQLQAAEIEAAVINNLV
jgi:hypothetical protein